MSADTVLIHHRGRSLSGPSHDCGTALLTASGAPRQVEPITHVVDNLGTIAAATVDPLDLAAALEASGMNDLQATRFGQADVFGLATEIFEAVPRRFDAPDRSTERVAVPFRSRPELQALTLVVPALVSVAVLATVPGGMHLLVVVALVLALGWGQAVAFLGHVALGRLDPIRARMTLRVGMLAGIALASAVMVPIALVTHQPPAVTVLAVGQLAYVGAATALVVLDARHLLVGALAPGLAGSLLVLAGGAPGALAVSSYAVTVAIAIVAALLVTRTRGAVPRGDGAALGTAVPYFVLGAATALVLLLVAVRLLEGRALLAMPMLVGLGAAEAQLLRLRRSGRDILADTRRLDSFAVRIRRLLLACSLRVMIVVSIGEAAVLVHLTVSGGISRGDVLATLAVTVLSAALFLALTLTAYGQVTIVLPWIIGVALASGVGAAAGDPAFASSLVAVTVLFFGLSSTAWSSLARPSTHR